MSERDASVSGQPPPREIRSAAGRSTRRASQEKDWRQKIKEGAFIGLAFPVAITGVPHHAQQIAHEWVAIRGEHAQEVKPTRRDGDQRRRRLLLGAEWLALEVGPDESGGGGWGRGSDTEDAQREAAVEMAVEVVDRAFEQAEAQGMKGQSQDFTQWVLLHMSPREAADTAVGMRNGAKFKELVSIVKEAQEGSKLT